MNELTVFENKDFGQIRTVVHQGEPWFVAADVCKALDLGNPSMTAERLDDDEKGISTIDTPGGKQNMAIINEPGLYSLVLGSRKPEAKAFKRWITHEVIPSIRKTGGYTVKADPAKNLRAEAMLLNARSRASGMWYKFAELVNAAEHKQLCASYGTQVLTGGQRVLPLPEVEETYSAEEAGKLLGGLSGQMVGRIATKHGLKVPKYGRLTLDKSRYSNKEVESWRYNRAGVEALRAIVESQQK